MSKDKKIRIPKRPEKFHSFSECVRWLKKSVYIIVRGRSEKINDQQVIRWTTLGTGFVAAQEKLLTAAHVVSNTQKDESSQHHDGDKYYLLKHDDDNSWHYRIYEPKINKDLFIFPEIDLAIFNLDKEFYQVDDKILADRNDFVRISKDFLPIGSEVGVLGYPLCKLDFANNDLSKPLIGNILLRVDKGVINCRYQTSKDKYLYEFTMAFNPGNSGGPIFDIRTGRLVSIVSGYKVIKINEKEVPITDEGKKLLKIYKEQAYIETLNASYSFGHATPSFLDIFRNNNIMN
ncbi:MAG: serine protease [Patescibacteria group bacterium]